MGQDKPNIRFTTLVQYVTPYTGMLILIVVLLLGESVISLLNPWLAGCFTGALLGEPGRLLYSYQQILLLWLGILAIQNILSFANNYLAGKTSEKMLAQLRLRLYDHLQALPIGYYHERKMGQVLALMSNDADIISNFVTDTLLKLLPQILVLIGALFFIFLISPFIAILAGLFVPAFYLVMKIVGRKIRPVSRAMIDEYANTFSILEENLHLLPIIKSFSREAIESERFQHGNQRLFNLTARYLRIQAILSPLVHFIAAAAIILLLWFSSGQLESGQLSAADLVSLLFYGMLLTRPVSGLADVYGQVQGVRGAAERLIEVFNIEPEPVDIGAPVLSPVRGKIEFRDVHFSYPGRDETLPGVNLIIEAGETIAITGKNGVGKSTLAYLLQRFADPQKGQILLDDIDIRSVDLMSLRSQIGVVQQRVLLLNDTVRENILFGRVGADDPAVAAAAHAARVTGFIQDLPDGFDTLIGDQGIKLSGGQTQRLALARALLKDPPVLILDEATAMFDPEGEKEFIQECHELLQQRTIILITHRPESLTLADRILEMKAGKF